MKKLFLLLLMWGTYIKTGFSSSTLIAINGKNFRPIQYISFFDYVNCFDGYYQPNSFQVSSLRSYEAPIGMCLSFGRTSVICDPQQLFKLYNRYEWIRACDIEEGCLLLDMYLKPVGVTSARLIHRPFTFYRFNVPFVGYHNFFVTDLCINVCNY